MLFKLSLVALIALVRSVSCSLQGRVVNGVNSKIEKFPFMVSVRNSERIHFCGGTIVAKHLILTAAHCVSDLLASEVSIQFGETVISADSKNVINVKRFIVHEDFNRSKQVGDIALLELEKPIVLVSKRVEAVKLPDPLFEVSNEKNGISGVLIGWGRKNDLGKTESNLQEVNLNIYSNKECYNRKAYATYKEICAGVDKGGKGPCLGDSGGPLLSSDSVQLGIVSAGIVPCSSFYDIYTKVSHYKAWIVKHF